METVDKFKELAGFLEQYIHNVDASLNALDERLSNLNERVSKLYEHAVMHGAQDEGVTMRELDRCDDRILTLQEKVRSLGDSIYLIIRQLEKAEIEKNLPTGLSERVGEIEGKLDIFGSSLDKLERAAAIAGLRRS